MRSGLSAANDYGGRAVLRVSRHALLLLAVLATGIMAYGEPEMSYRIDRIPESHSLYAYDDCGVEGRQPHVQMKDCILWTFNTSDTNADLKSRSAAFSYKQIEADYDDLEPNRSYILALTYASDHVYKRVQSLWADGVELHGPLALPNGKAIRVLLRVPESVTQDGRMKLEIKMHGEANATVSIIELWATGQPRSRLRIDSLVATPEGLTGRMLDMAYEGARGARIRLFLSNQDKPLGEATTGDGGWFAFDPRLWEGRSMNEDMRVVAGSGDDEVSALVPASAVDFKPIRYRPMPTSVAGLKSNTVSLDGIWRIDPKPSDGVRKKPLSAAGWADIRMPGQWLQQGFDVPEDKPVAMAREFTIPKEWAGYRVFLRFDAIHAGTDYWLNGKKLGYSESLFTPVEWDITDAVRPGQANRLDLWMKVATASERLSHSCGYAFHSLGGIDRSVRVYALPQVHMKDLRLTTDLDASYRDAEMKLDFTLDNPQRKSDLSVHVSLLDPKGKPVRISQSSVSSGTTVHVTNPLKWTAETPHLYKLVIELRDGENLIERVERSIGFRKIEVRGRQVYINGRRVKFAGACHHELDPLTGRADTARYAEQDVKLMKEGNLNYLRTSHYPPTQELLDACDRLGMYVECESPFCWVAPTDGLDDLKEILTPTSAMIDYNHMHPSIIVWSLANESSFNKAFEISNKLCKNLDPTRLTTFNNPDPARVCDIANAHYPPMPWDNVLNDDPRPLFLGEYMFPVCHEQVDVRINPGMRELPGQGQADPNSDWGRACTKVYDTLPMSGAKPGFWTQVYDSDRVIGGAIWAALDEPFYFADGKHCGYAWVHGFWGLIDAWRRPKPELWLTKMIFSPVWFPVRQVSYSAGQTSVRVPVENRYSFTDLKDLKFAWEVGGKKGKIKTALPPGKKGKIEIPVPEGTPEGEQVTLRVTNANGELVNALKITLGRQTPVALPKLSGPPKWTDDGKTVAVSGSGWCLVFDRSTGNLIPNDPRYNSAIVESPSLHVTRSDPSDLNPNGLSYAVFPDEKTRVVDGVTIKELPEGLDLSVLDHYDGFTGAVHWIIAKNGMSRVSYDYTYTGDGFNTREIGARLLLKPECDELKWRRWSEWGIFPDDSICRTEGLAKARRGSTVGPDLEGIRPNWSWALDQTELGTNDFRGAKFNIYDASLTASNGTGVKVYAQADMHSRACLAENGVKLHILTQCLRGPVALKKGDRIAGQFVLELLHR